MKTFKVEYEIIDRKLQKIFTKGGDPTGYSGELKQGPLGKKRLKITNERNEEVGEITEKKYRFGLYDLVQFVITAGGEKITLAKEMKELKSYYVIEPDSISLKGDWMGSDFEIQKDQETIARVENKKDSFFIEIIKENYETLSLSILFGIIWVFYYKRLL